MTDFLLNPARRHEARRMTRRHNIAKEGQTSLNWLLCACVSYITEHVIGFATREIKARSYYRLKWLKFIARSDTVYIPTFFILNSKLKFFESSTKSTHAHTYTECITQRMPFTEEFKEFQFRTEKDNFYFTHVSLVLLHTLESLRSHINIFYKSVFANNFYKTLWMTFTKTISSDYINMNIFIQN